MSFGLPVATFDDLRDNWRPPLKLGFATERVRRQSAWWARGPYFSALLSAKQVSRVKSFGAATPGPRGQLASREGLRLPHLLQLPCLCEIVASRWLAAVTTHNDKGLGRACRWNAPSPQLAGVAVKACESGVGGIMTPSLTSYPRLRGSLRAEQFGQHAGFAGLLWSTRDPAEFADRCGLKATRAEEILSMFWAGLSRKWAIQVSASP
nr:hypothetical protein Iba_chr01dCG0790 [Ipomoea batatas]